MLLTQERQEFRDPQERKESKDLLSGQELRDPQERRDSQEPKE